MLVQRLAEVSTTAVDQTFRSYCRSRIANLMAAEADQALQQRVHQPPPNVIVGEVQQVLT
ncbi:MAG: hypothetical protein AB8E87_01230 [Prochlorococcus sp.]